jgi:beta-1,4-mannosyl-glycoprotein beta-1,4-N-acetylglucosaminyltransferase
MIYDTFIFSDELDLLDVRLHELADVVDYHVLVEATRTFANKPKPLFYQENKGRYEDFKHKIISVVVDDLPDGESPYKRERYQRRCISRGLAQKLPNVYDTVIVSDADEIPNVSALRQYIPKEGPKAFEQHYFCYFVNNLAPHKWCGSRVMSYREMLLYGGPHDARHTVLPKLQDGGWHFSYLGDIDAIRRKVTYSGNGAFDGRALEEDYYLKAVINSGSDLFGRDFRWQVTEDRALYPLYIQSQWHRFQNWMRHETNFHSSHEGGNLNPDHQIRFLHTLYRPLMEKQGLILFLGAWEGKAVFPFSLLVIPEKLTVVDDWKGYLGESKSTNHKHNTVLLAEREDVYALFNKNARVLSQGNVEVLNGDPLTVLEKLDKPVKFAYLDKDNDATSVTAYIQAISRLLVPGGIIAGNNIIHAHIRRRDLQGGVEKAVRDNLPGYNRQANVWYWQKPEDLQSKLG